MTKYTDDFESRIGTVGIVVDASGAVAKLRFGSVAEEGGERSRVRCAHVIEQLREYFSGDRKEFALTLAPEGTEFQKRVWKELESIPYGETMSYGEVAKRIGNGKAIRAVGRANGANPVPIVVPCHRVIGADGKLVGYAGGMEIKMALLEIEGVQCGRLFRGR